MSDRATREIELFETLIEGYNMQIDNYRKLQSFSLDHWTKAFLADKILQMELERDGYQLRLDKLKAKQNDF